MKTSTNHTLTLYNVVKQIALNHLEEAQRELQDLLDSVKSEQNPSAIKYYLFGNALASRISESTAKEANLYLKNYEVPQIQLFNLLAHQVPLVYLPTLLANSTIAQECQRREEVTLIDVGIGTGRQTLALLKMLCDRNALPKRLLVIGIEPSDWSLKLAENNLQATASSMGVELKFVPLCNIVENLSEREWDELHHICREPIINASFALHHIQDVDGKDVRNEVLQRLRSLNPSALVLSEPNVDHVEKDFVQRFHNCWCHFGLIVKVIDELIIEQQDKNALKISFFGREIADIISYSEIIRTERHETTSSWLNRLKTSGFNPKNSLTLPELPNTSLVQVTPQEGYFSIDYEGNTLVSVLHAEAA